MYITLLIRRLISEQAFGINPSLTNTFIYICKDRYLLKNLQYMLKPLYRTLETGCSKFSKQPSFNLNIVYQGTVSHLFTI